MKTYELFYYDEIVQIILFSQLISFKIFNLYTLYS